MPAATGSCRSGPPRRTAWLALALSAACTVDDQTPEMLGPAAPTAGNRAPTAMSPMAAAPAAGAGAAGGGSAGAGAGGVSDPGHQAGEDAGGEPADASALDAGSPEQPPADAGGDARPPAGDGFYRLEDLDRGLVAVRTEGGVYVGFRMLGYEYDAADPGRVAYELRRDGTRIATLTDSTNYLDSDGDAEARYAVRPIYDGAPGIASDEITPWAENFLRIPLEPPSASHSANDASAADLDGDGQYELVLKWEPDNARDNSQAGYTDNVYLDGLELDGTRLWRIDLGRNIRAGAHYTQFVVYDFDGDGRAELAVKTAPGTRDGSGSFLARGPAASADHGADYRNGDGYVLAGPEYLSVFEGDSGVEAATVAFEQARGDVRSWGDDYGNRVDRFLATAAHLDQSGLASIVMARGYYTRTTLTAWTFRQGELRQQWKFDSNRTPSDANNRSFSGQGCHSLSVANVDGDLEQEIVYGAMTIDHDGRGMCSTGLGHGDALHVGDLLPERPGLESFMPHESANRPAWSLRDAASCGIIRQGPLTDGDIGRGVAADVLPRMPGAELWTSGGVPFQSAATGEAAGAAPPSINFVIWWDGDESRELEDGTAIAKYGAGVLQSCTACAANNGTKATPVLSADLIGDWREEILWRESSNRALRLYTTTAATTRRIYTLMHDAQYRIAISWQNGGYNQPPHPSFHIGAGMSAPPPADIRVR